MSDHNETLRLLTKDVGLLEASYEALHTRTDKLEKNIEGQLTKIVATLDRLVAAEHKRTGWIAAMVFMGSLISGIVTYLAKG